MFWEIKLDKPCSYLCSTISNAAFQLVKWGQLKIVETKHRDTIIPCYKITLLIELNILDNVIIMIISSRIVSWELQVMFLLHYWYNCSTLHSIRLIIICIWFLKTWIKCRKRLSTYKILLNRKIMPPEENKLNVFLC